MFEKPARGRVAVLWNGRDDSGRVVPDSFYRARVRLDLIEKTFTLPNLIRVDTNRPGVKVVSVRPRVFSPDGDRRSDRIGVRYRVDERARGTLYVDGVRRVVGSSLKPTGELRWYGKVDGASVPPGRYALTVVAVDPAGNRSLPVNCRQGHGSLRRARAVAAPREGRRHGQGQSVHRCTPRLLAARQAQRYRPAAGVSRPGAERGGALPARRLGRRPRSRQASGGDGEVTRRRWVIALVLGCGRARRGSDRGRLVVPGADDGEGGARILDGRVRAARQAAGEAASEAGRRRGALADVRLRQPAHAPLALQPQAPVPSAAGCCVPAGWSSSPPSWGTARCS